MRASKKIGVMIGGMQKCGTTSLFNYLDSHNELVGHWQTEMSYFISDAEYARGWTRSFDKYYRGKKIGPNQQLLAKHSTLIASKPAIEKLKAHNPDVKIIIILRDPVYRAYSSFLMEVGYGEKKDALINTFNEVLEMGNVDFDDRRQRSYIGYGQYARFLQQLYEKFGNDQIKIVLLEHLQQHPKIIISEIIGWLGLNTEKIEIENGVKRYNTAKTIRSKYLGVLINYFLNENNLIKQGLKWMLPPALIVSSGHFFRNLNRKRIDNLELEDSVKNELKKYYHPYNLDLKKEFSIDISVWNS